jgi:hypothetical protein
MVLVNHYRKPPHTKCSKSPNFWGVEAGHQWEFNLHWNGNMKSVLPWVKRTSGIGRAGWRCAHCGKMYWALDDASFAENYAMNTDVSLKFAVNQLRGLDRWGRELSHYDRCVTSKGKPFVVKQTDESITIRCNGDIVARWSSGEMYRDYADYIEWLEITGVSVEGADTVFDPDKKIA